MFLNIIGQTHQMAILVKAPYDAIHVGAAAPTLPTALVEQLARPGRMFIPVGNVNQYIELVDKGSDGDVGRKRIMGVRVSSPTLDILAINTLLLVCSLDRSSSTNPSRLASLVSFRNRHCSLISKLNFTFFVYFNSRNSVRHTSSRSRNPST